MSLNDYITKAAAVTAPSTGIPVPDRTEQTNFGLGLVQHMAQQSRSTPEPPKVMAPIVPLSN